MAFVSAITSRDVWGSKAIVLGTYTNGAGDSGGDINTGLHRCEGIFLQPNGAAVSANAPVFDETLPVDGSAVTIVTDAGEDGSFIAIGDAHV
jgi:hypothetical protein